MWLFDCIHRINKERRVKVLIEIEKSGKTPTHILGKFFTAAISQKYIDKRDQIFDIKPVSALFIQIVDASNMMENYFITAGFAYKF